MLNWLIATVVSLSIGTLIYFVTTSFSVLRWGIRAGLLSTIGGLLAYMYLATHLPGSEQLLSYFGIWGVMMVTILGAGIGWGTSYGWQKISNSN